MTDLTKLKELAERATPGPWGRSGSDICTQRQEDGTTYVECWNVLGYVTRHENADYVAAANPQAILGLIERLEKAEQHWATENSNNMALIAEVERLRQFAAEVYQVLGALDAPENVLDNASDAAGGAPLRHKTLLPFFAEGYEALRKDAERYRELRKITPHRFKKMQEAATTDGGDVFYFHADRFDAALDAAMEGGGR